MKLTTSTNSSHSMSLATTYAIGAPGGGVLIVVFWYLLPVGRRPGYGNRMVGVRLLAAYLLAPVWAPLFSGFATLRLARMGGLAWC